MVAGDDEPIRANDVAHIGEVAPGESDNFPQREMDAYGIMDVNMGIQADEWELQAFITNLTDERAELYWDTDNHHTFWGHNQLVTNRPREYGMRFLYKWGGE